MEWLHRATVHLGWEQLVSNVLKLKYKNALSNIAAYLRQSRRVAADFNRLRVAAEFYIAAYLQQYGILPTYLPERLPWDPGTIADGAGALSSNAASNAIDALERFQ